MFAATTEEGAGSPPPPPALVLRERPPEPVQEHQGDDFDPNRARGLYRIWDVVLIFGPITDAEVRAKVGLTQGSWQVYVQYHRADNLTEADESRLRDKSTEWYLNHEISVGLRNGYLVRDTDDRLSIGTCPPEHTPPTKQQMNDAHLRDDNVLALEILRNKASRMDPDPDKYDALKESIRDRGQLYPIKRIRDGGGWLIVDGRTREQIADDLGIDPIYDPGYPGDRSILDALRDRIDLELHATTKDQTTRSRNAYIARLAKLGYSQTAIAAKVGLSRQRVDQILSAMQPHLHRGQNPASEVISEWVRLSDAGWSLRDIAEDYVWSKSTVAKYIDQHRNGSTAVTAATTTPVTAATTTKNVRLKQGGHAAKFLWYLWQHPDGATTPEVEKRMGIGRSQTKVPPLAADDLIVADGKRGKSTVWVITDLGEAVISAHTYDYSQHLDQTAAPATTPKPNPVNTQTTTTTASTSTTVTEGHVHECKYCDWVGVTP